MSRPVVLLLILSTTLLLQTVCVQCGYGINCPKYGEAWVSVGNGSHKFYQDFTPGLETHAWICARQPNQGQGILWWTDNYADCTTMCCGNPPLCAPTDYTWITCVRKAGDCYLPLSGPPVPNSDAGVNQCFSPIIACTNGYSYGSGDPYLPCNVVNDGCAVDLQTGREGGRNTHESWDFMFCATILVTQSQEAERCIVTPCYPIHVIHHVFPYPGPPATMRSVFIVRRLLNAAPVLVDSGRVELVSILNEEGGDSVRTYVSASGLFANAGFRVVQDPPGTYTVDLQPAADALTGLVMNNMHFQFEALTEPPGGEGPVPVEQTTWGKIKSHYQ